MTPLQPVPVTNDETVASLPNAKPIGDRPDIVTPPPGVADPDGATIAHSGPSEVTVDEKVDATNFGKYQLLGELARGGMGVVYRAKQHGLARVVALKMILGAGLEKESKERFFQEARAAAAIDHPNVVPIYDIDEIGGRPYFTMAFVEGPNLRSFVEDNGLPPAPTLVSLFSQIVAGVAHAHRLGIVHRDLKPANVLIDKDGRPRVTDFGLAKQANADTQLTAAGQVLGTPAYMAPEQARESKDVSPAADVYSLGAILYFMLTGRAPFHADSIADLLIKVVMEQPITPREVRPEVPTDLEELCLRCLSKSPSARFADAQELLAALAPITDQYLSPSANLSPSMAQIAFAKGTTSASLSGMPSMNSAGTVPTLGSVLPRLATNAPNSAAGPVTKTNRKPMLIALGTFAIVLLGVIGYLVSQNKSAPNASTQPNTPITDNKGTDLAKVDTLAWPIAGRADFGLKVELRAPAASKADDGSVRLIAGNKMQIHLKADQDCHVSVWVFDPSGQATRLFPNDDDTDDRLTAGSERVVPKAGAYDLEAVETEGAGLERLRVIATTGAQPPFPPGAKAGRFMAYANGPDREKLASTVRGIVIKKPSTSEPGAAAGAVSEAEIMFRVQK